MFFSYVKQKFYIFCTYLWIFFIIYKNQCGTLSGNIKKEGLLAKLLLIAVGLINTYANGQMFQRGTQ